MNYAHRDRRFMENWNKTKNENRDAAHSRQMEREAAGHEVVMRGQDVTSKGQDLLHKQHGAEMGLKWDQHGTQKQQWGKEFGEKKRQFNEELGMRGNELMSVDAWRQGTMAEDKRQFNISRQDERGDVKYERDQAQADTLLAAVSGVFGGSSDQARERVDKSMSNPETRKEMAGLLEQAMSTIDKGTSAQDTIQTIAPLIASMRGLTGLGMPGEDVDPLDTFKETETLFELMKASGKVNANQADAVLEVARKKAMDEHKDWRSRQPMGDEDAWRRGQQESRNMQRDQAMRSGSEGGAGRNEQTWGNAITDAAKKWFTRSPSSTGVGPALSDWWNRPVR